MIIKKEYDEEDIADILVLAATGSMSSFNAISEEIEEYKEPAVVYFIASKLPHIYSEGTRIYQTKTGAPEELADLDRIVERLTDLLVDIPDKVSFRAPHTEEDVEKYKKAVDRFTSYLDPEITKVLNDIYTRLKEAMGSQELQEAAPQVDVGAILRTMRYYDSKSDDDRRQIYEYWETLNGDFTTLHGDSEILALLGGLGSQTVKVEPELAKSLMSLNGMRLPNYIIEIPALDVFQYRDDVVAEAIVNKLFTREEFSRNLAAVKGRTASMGGYLMEEGQEGDIEEEVFDINIEDAEEYLRKVNEIKDVDPILALEKIHDDNSFIVNDNIRNSLEKISQSLMQSEDISYIRDLYEVIMEELDNNVASMQQDIIYRDVYYLPIMDDNKNKGVLNLLIKSLDYNFINITVSYNAEEGEVTLDYGEDSERGLTYNQVVAKINNDANELFSVLSELSSSVKMSPYYSGLGDVTEGGITPPQGGKPPSMDKFFSELTLMSFIKRYYFNSLQYRYLYGRDLPQFAEKSTYRTLEQSIRYQGGRFYEGMVDNLTKNPKFLDSGSIDSLIGFFKTVNKMSTQTNEQIISSFERVHLALSKMIILARGPPSESRKMNQDMRNFFGILLKSQLGEAGGNKMFLGRPLRSYNTVPTDNVVRELLEDLIALLKDEDFVKYARRHNLSKIDKLISAIKRSAVYEDGIKKSLSAYYLDALDTLRQIRDMPVYKAYLDVADVEDVEMVIDIIKQEDNVDLFMVDIEKMIESESSFDTIAKSHGVNPLVVYKVKGLFR